MALLHLHPLLVKDREKAFLHTLLKPDSDLDKILGGCQQCSLAISKILQKPFQHKATPVVGANAFTNAKITTNRCDIVLFCRNESLL